MTLEYMKWVTNNKDTFVPNKMNVVACVYCRAVYSTSKCGLTNDNCLICYNCGIDALMVVAHSPLRDLAESDQMALLNKWHVDGFTPLLRE
jgi:hypothetical protein